MPFFSPADDVALYESLKGYILSEEMLIESNYPVQHPEKCGCAFLFADSKKVNTDRKCDHSSLEGALHCQVGGKSRHISVVCFEKKPSRGSAVDVEPHTL